MKIMKPFLLAALVMLTFAACKNIKYKKTAEGLMYSNLGGGSGDKIIPGNVVRYHQTSQLEDSVLGTTYGTPARWLPLAPKGPQQGLANLVLEAQKGDSILVLQSVDSIIAKSQAGPVDSFLLRNRGRNIKTYIKITDVFKDDVAAQAAFEVEAVENYKKEPTLAAQRTKDEAAIAAYLKANNISATPTPWGVYIQTLAPGSGPKAKPGEFVSVRYKGRLLNGTEFDNNTDPGDPVFPVQVGGQGSIFGFQEGVKQFSKGAKGLIVIPSTLGYAAQGSPPKIGPNENLVFEIEVVDISAQPPAPPMSNTPPPPPPAMDSAARR